MVPCRPSCLILLPGIFPKGANSRDGGPRRHGSLVVFFASWNVVCLIFVDRRSRYDCSLTLMYARAGFEGLEGLVRSAGVFRTHNLRLTLLISFPPYRQPSRPFQNPASIRHQEQPET